MTAIAEAKTALTLSDLDLTWRIVARRVRQDHQDGWDWLFDDPRGLRGLVDADRAFLMHRRGEAGVELVAALRPAARVRVGEGLAVTFSVIPGTDINEIRTAHPDWTEDQCRDEQKRVAFIAWGLAAVPPRWRLTPGQKVKFSSERLRYTVRASNERFAICTKPFNPRRTTLYTIIDFARGVRGRENLIFGMGFETDEDCQQALQRLIFGESEVSHRHCIPLDLEPKP